MRSKEEKHEHKHQIFNLPKKNYHISKHRYYELKHFCLQYKEWQTQITNLSLIQERTLRESKVDGRISDPTAEKAIYLSRLTARIDMIRKAAYEADNVTCEYIFRAVTEDLAYTYFEMNTDYPFGRSYFYEKYRKFFYILDKLRN